jgi:lipopolysaccharide/colanic/teichoic acid biosynthesis glycosyltransferase
VLDITERVKDVTMCDTSLTEDFVLDARTKYERFGKRAVDITLASAALVGLAPAFGAIAVASRIFLGRKVLFRQRRVGRAGVSFWMYKFRTMHPDRRVQVQGRPYNGPERRCTHKSADDPRHTTYGRLLRKTSLDELPQLWNVLRGDMSLVGPRPEIEAVVDRYGLRQHPRHLVRPGLTGVWQVSPSRTNLLVEGVDIDLRYVEDVSLKRDVELMAKTVPAVIRATGH